MYQIVIGASAEKDMEHLPAPVLKRVARAIDLLRNNPRPHGCIKLKGSKEELWRVRVGDYRIIYSIADQLQIVDIRRVRNRKDVYEQR